MLKISHLHPVAYLECAKGGGPGAQWGPGAKTR